MSASNAANDSIWQIFDYITKPVNHFRKGIKDFVSESSFSNLFPNLFYWVHLWSIRRNKSQMDIIRDFQSFRFMPPGAITYQQYLVIGIRFGQLTEKSVHAVCIAVWHNQKEAISCKRLYRPVSIPVFPNMVTRNGWSHSFSAPATLGFIDPTESRFILKHNSYCLVCISYTKFFLYGLNFFEESCSS